MICLQLQYRYEKGCFKKYLSVYEQIKWMPTICNWLENIDTTGLLIINSNGREIVLFYSAAN